MFPEEDRPPAWLRDFGDIEADLNELAEFAKYLDTEVRQDYIPRLAPIYDDMSVKLPDPCDAFIELVQFLRTHQSSQQATTNLVHFFRDATGGLAVAAGEISERYAGTDAFAAAQLGEIEQALDRTATARAPGTSPSTGSEATA